MLKIIQGVDSDNYFKLNEAEENDGVLSVVKSYNTKKIMNYFYYFTDLIETDQTMLFAPIRYNEDISFFESLFGYKYDNNNLNSYNHNPLSNFYTSSLIGLDNLNMVLPFMSSYKGNETKNEDLYSLNTVNSNKSKYNYDKKNGIDSKFYYNNNPKLDYLSNNLIRNNNINFFHSDISFHLDHEVNYKNSTNKFFNNGYLLTYNKNLKYLKEKLVSNVSVDANSPLDSFNWDKHFSYLSKFKNGNFSVSHGYDEKHRVMSSPVDKFLNITSSLNCSNTSKIPLPFCFPRYIYNKDDNTKKEFITNSSIMSIYSHDYLYANNFLSFIPEYLKKKSFEVERYLRKIDLNRYLELNDRTESLYRIFDFYDDYKEFCDDDGSDNDY